MDSFNPIAEQNEMKFLFLNDTIHFQSLPELINKKIRQSQCQA